MDGETNTEKRHTCSRCQRPPKVCYCASLPALPLFNRWPVHILQHPHEARHPLGTARIAELGLTNCRVHAANAFNLDNVQLTGVECEPVLVYPGGNALAPSALLKAEVRPLLFLDATWKKSRRMLYEQPALADLPRISINADQVSRYRIRKSPGRGSLSTLEAVIHVLSMLEPDQQFDVLLAAMDAMVQRQIDCMGEATFQKNYADYG